MSMIITIYSSIINVSFYEEFFILINVFIQPLITIIFNSIYGKRLYKKTENKRFMIT